MLTDPSELDLAPEDELRTIRTIRVVKYFEESRGWFLGNAAFDEARQFYQISYEDYDEEEFTTNETENHLVADLYDIYDEEELMSYLQGNAIDSKLMLVRKRTSRIKSENKVVEWELAQYVRGTARKCDGIVRVSLITDGVVRSNVALHLKEYASTSRLMSEASWMFLSQRDRYPTHVRILKCAGSSFHLAKVDSVCGDTAVVVYEDGVRRSSLSCTDLRALYIKPLRSLTQYPQLSGEGEDEEERLLRTKIIDLLEYEIGAMEYIVIRKKPLSSTNVPSRDTWRTVRPLKPIRRAENGYRGVTWHVQDQRTDEKFNVMLKFNEHGAHAQSMSQITWFSAPPCWIDMLDPDEAVDRAIASNDSFVTPNANKKRRGGTLSMTANKKKRRLLKNIKVRKEALEKAARVSFVVYHDELPQTLQAWTKQEKEKQRIEVKENMFRRILSDMASRYRRDVFPLLSAIPDQPREQWMAKYDDVINRHRELADSYANGVEDFMPEILNHDFTDFMIREKEKWGIDLNKTICRQCCPESDFPLVAPYDHDRGKAVRVPTTLPSFRKGQMEVCVAILKSVQTMRHLQRPIDDDEDFHDVNARPRPRDVIFQMSTNHGKTLCFTLPIRLLWETRATYNNAVVLIVSPRIRLIDHHVASLRRSGIPAVALKERSRQKCAVNDERGSDGMEQDITQRIEDGGYFMVFATPQKLTKNRSCQKLFERLHEHRRLLYVVFDEIHELNNASARGYQADYLQFVRSLRAPTRPESHQMWLGKDSPPFVLCSATLREAVVNNISKALRLHRPYFLRMPTPRINLKLSVVRPLTSDSAERCALAAKYVEKALEENRGHGRRPSKPRQVIVFCLTKRTCKLVARSLNEILGQEINVGYVCSPPSANDGPHAMEERRLIERNNVDWENGTLHVVCATPYLGLGVNNPNVRLVLHYELTLSLGNYNQQVGRAGRDDEDAEAVLFFRYEDVSTARHVLGIASRDSMSMSLSEGIRKEHELKSMIDYAIEGQRCRHSMFLSAAGCSAEEEHFRCNTSCDNCMAKRVSKIGSDADVTDTLVRKSQRWISDNKGVSKKEFKTWLRDQDVWTRLPRNITSTDSKNQNVWLADQLIRTMRHLNIVTESREKLFASETNAFPKLRVLLRQTFNKCVMCKRYPAVMMASQSWHEAFPALPTCNQTHCMNRIAKWKNIAKQNTSALEEKCSICFCTDEKKLRTCGAKHCPHRYCVTCISFLRFPSKTSRLSDTAFCCAGITPIGSRGG